MFTGIVEELGEVAGLTWDAGHRSGVLRVTGPLVATDAKDGDSISVNGVCLTVTAVAAGGEVSFDVMRETFDRSALGSLAPGDPVMAMAVPVGSRLGAQAELVVVPRESVARVPEGMSLVEASTLPMNSMTAHYAFADEDTVIQLNSTGPWALTYVNPTDDPRQQTQ